MEKSKKSQTKEEKAIGGKLVLIRIRGRVHLRHTIEDALRHLNLNTVNSCTVIDNVPEYKGMITQVNDYVTWGEIDEATFIKLLKEKGRIAGNKKLDDNYLAAKTKYGSIKEYAEAFMKSQAKISDVPELKHMFRLSPPVGGHEKKGIKKPYVLGGVLGYRGKEIKELLERMI
jgi:large subunit ribosomal protein L30